MIIAIQVVYLPNATYFHIHDTHRVVLKKTVKKNWSYYNLFLHNNHILELIKS